MTVLVGGTEEAGWNATRALNRTRGRLGVLLNSLLKLLLPTSPLLRTQNIGFVKILHYIVENKEEIHFSKLILLLICAHVEYKNNRF
ncbi:MAG: hypothetical protein LBN04_10870 [Oscillospiraceae bacterium]|jgi:hypothetical protein|nr:hypothetical protein [Oscillospiraceae bacterium]